jgi:choline transporter-like protein 2/4/5
MGCCSKEKKHEVFVEKRKCTDLFCVVLFLAYALGMLFLAYLTVSAGNPYSLLYGSDYEGRICGTEEMENYPLTYYPQIAQDMLVAASEGKTNPLTIPLTGVCVEECPTIGDVVCTDAGELALQEYMDGTSTDDRLAARAACNDLSAWMSAPECRTISSECWIVPLRTNKMLYRCLWAKEQRSNVTIICESPPALEGLHFSEMTPEEQEQCVTATTITVTEQRSSAQPDPVADKIADLSESIGILIADIMNSISVVLVVGGAVVFFGALLWVVLLRCCVKPIIWGTIWIACLALIGATVMAFYLAGYIDSTEVLSAVSQLNSDTFDSNSTLVALGAGFEALPTAADTGADAGTWEIFAWIAAVVTFVFITIVIALRKKIKTAIAITREASRVVQRVPTMLVCPITTTATLLIVLAFFVIVGAFIYTAGDSVSPDAAIAAATTTINTVSASAGVDITVDASNGTYAVVGQAFEQSNIVGYMFAYHLFGCLWMAQIALGFSMVVVAGVVCQWYFTADKKKGMPRRPLITSLRRAIKHSGTIIFGAAVIAIVQFLRLILEYVDRKTKDLQESNMAIKVMLKVIKCCMWCFEKCIKFITRYAFIYTALKGKGFLSSAKGAAMLIIKQFAQIAVIGTISTVVIIVSKFMMVAIAGILAFLWLENDEAFGPGGEKELSGKAFPLFCTVILAYAVSSAVFSVYDLAISTILLCFCEDKEQNDGSAEKPYYMTNELMKITGVKNSEEGAAALEAKAAEERAKAGRSSKSDAAVAPSEEDAAAASSSGEASGGDGAESEIV